MVREHSKQLADDPKLGGMLIEFLDGFAALQRLEK